MNDVVVSFNADDRDGENGSADETNIQEDECLALSDAVQNSVEACGTGDDPQWHDENC